MQRKYSNQPSVLERAQKQLQGKRLSVPGSSSGGRTASQERRKEDNDLDAYLSKLSRKVTLASGKKTTSTLGDDLSDISISSDGGHDGPKTNLSASRFVKKSHSQTLDDSGSLQRKSEVFSGGLTLKKSATTPSFLNKTAPVYASTALQKAAKLGAKFAKQKQSTENLPDSESDFDVSLSDDGNYIPKNQTKFTNGNAAGVGKEKTQETKKASLFSNLQSSDEDELKRDGNKFLKKKPAKPSFYVAESDEDDEDKFGRDGSKFLKKPASNPPTSALPKTDTDEGDGSRFLKKSTKRPPLQDTKPTKAETRTNENMFMTSTPKKKTDMQPAKSKFSRKALAETSFGLDSDEEDLQEFIMNLSPTSSPEIPPIREKKQVSGKGSDQAKESKQTGPEKSTPGRRPATPAAKKVFASRDVTFPRTDSAVSEDRSAESIATESIEEDRDSFSGIHTNIMRLEDLEPIGISANSAMPKAQVVDSSKEDIASEISDHNSIKEDFFTGLQTVDDLLARETFGKHDRGIVTRKDGYKSDFDSADEIGTEPEQSISEVLSEVHTEAIKRSGSKTPGDVYATDTFVSPAESLSETSSRTAPDSHSEVTSDEVTSDEVTSNEDTSRRSRHDKRKIHSDSRDTLTKTSISQGYSDDFHTRHTDSEVEDFSSDEDRTRVESVTHSRSFTSYTESRSVTKSETPRKGRRDGGRKKKCKDAAVQADGATSATHRWLRDLDLSDLGSVTGVDPTPVAMHVINPQALEALISYSPNILAMNQSFLSQLRHTQEMIQTSLRLHQSFMENIESDYSYTTLKETKEYIRRHRRPKMTMEEAVAEVRREMEEGYR